MRSCKVEHHDHVHTDRERHHDATGPSRCVLRSANLPESSLITAAMSPPCVQRSGIENAKAVRDPERVLLVSRDGHSIDLSGAPCRSGRRKLVGGYVNLLVHRLREVRRRDSGPTVVQVVVQHAGDHLIQRLSPAIRLQDVDAMGMVPCHDLCGTQQTGQMHIRLGIANGRSSIVVTGLLARTWDKVKQ